MKTLESRETCRPKVVDLFPGAMDEPILEARTDQFPELVAAFPFSPETGEARVVSLGSGSIRECHPFREDHVPPTLIGNPDS